MTQVEHYGTCSVMLDSGLVHWGLTPQQQPGSYQGGEMMMKSVFWWRKPEYPEDSGLKLYKFHFCSRYSLIFSCQYHRLIYYTNLNQFKERNCE